MLGAQIPETFPDNYPGHPPEGVPPKDPCDDSDPTNKKVLDFIKSHWDAAKAIAAGLQTTPENILGLSGEESTWGQDPKIPKTNNFFNLHPVAPGQVGVYPPGTPPRKYNNALAVFPSAGGYEASAQAFASGKMGKGIKGITDSIAFADKLAALGYNGIPPQNPNFASLVRGAIDSILSRINCPQLSATVKKQK
jgi:hypothetical protein